MKSPCERINLHALLSDLQDTGSTFDFHTDSYPAHYYTDLRIRPPSRTPAPSLIPLCAIPRHSLLLQHKAKWFSPRRHHLSNPSSPRSMAATPTSSSLPSRQHLSRLRLLLRPHPQTTSQTARLASAPDPTLHTMSERKETHGTPCHPGRTTPPHRRTTISSAVDGAL